MNLRLMDLNLLLVFEAVVRERSVTRAAARLNTTQPAISQALGRLRTLLGDELFRRTPHGMEPTPYCNDIVGPVRVALEGLQVAFNNASPFDPATSCKTFTIALDNKSALLIGAPLAIAIKERAPGVTLNLVPSGTLDLVDALDDSRLDLVLGGLSVESDRFARLPLFEDGFLAMTRRGHPGSATGTLSLPALADYPHLELSSTHEETAFVDARLAEHGYARRIVLRAPLLSAASALLQSDMIAILSERGARAFASYVPLQVLALPFETPRIPTNVLWHRRYDRMPAHRWLRSAVVDFARSGDCPGCVS